MMKRNCGFDVAREDGVIVLTLHGEIDHHSAVQIRTAIDELLYEEHPKKTVLDLSKIEFMDSSGLGLIMGRHNRIKELGGVLKVGNPGKTAVRMMKMSGADKLIPIIYTQEKDG